MPLIGSGENKWQIVHTDDVISAVVFCLEHEETEGEIFNVAEEQASTLNELITAVQKEYGIQENKKHVPVWLGYFLGFFNSLVCRITRKPNILSQDNIQRIIKNRWYSIEKLKKLGWKPNYDMKQSIRWIIRELEKR